ncbi:MAG: PASTA domain-containing protein [Planctomyces sp.]|nr:PASTA domain-containing protein [Planctomyces sp.]
MLRSFITSSRAVSFVVLAGLSLSASTAFSQTKANPQTRQQGSQQQAKPQGTASRPSGGTGTQTARPTAPGGNEPSTNSGRVSLGSTGQGNAPTSNTGEGVPVRPVSVQEELKAELNQRIKALPPGMYQLLDEWHQSSSEIDRLEGGHLRRVYDTVFKVEYMSNGKFYYEKPDKGRLDVTPMKIDAELLAARENGSVPAMKDKDGKVFAVKSDKNEQWVCDGQRIYQIHVDTKEAEIMALPAGMGGVNIMDSPLPFLFGIPADKAVDRFDLTFSKPFDRQSGFARIKALSRHDGDKQNWSSAEIILELKTMLPSAVRIYDPAGTKITSYTFTELKVNEKDWFRLPGARNVFAPDLRGYKTNVIQDSPMIPNVEGMAYQDAVIQLERVGMKGKGDNKNIFLDKGAPAVRTEDVFRVQKQTPAAGTPVQPGQEVRLTLFTEMKTGEARQK